MFTRASKFQVEREDSDEHAQLTPSCMGPSTPILNSSNRELLSSVRFVFSRDSGKVSVQQYLADMYYLAHRVSPNIRAVSIIFVHSFVLVELCCSAQVIAYSSPYTKNACFQKQGEPFVYPLHTTSNPRGK